MAHLAFTWFRNRYYYHHKSINLVHIDIYVIHAAKDRPNSSEKHEKSDTQKSSKRSKKDHGDKHSKHEKDGGSRSNKPRSNLPKSQSQQTVNDQLTDNKG